MLFGNLSYFQDPFQQNRLSLILAFDCINFRKQVQIFDHRKLQTLKTEKFTYFENHEPGSEVLKGE